MVLDPRVVSTVLPSLLVVVEMMGIVVMGVREEAEPDVVAAAAAPPAPEEKMATAVRADPEADA